VLVTAQNDIDLDDYNVGFCKEDRKFLLRGRNWIST